MADESKKDVERSICADMLMWHIIRGLLLLAMRHPQVPDYLRGSSVVFVKRIDQILMESGFMTMSELRETATENPEMLMTYPTVTECLNSRLDS